MKKKSQADAAPATESGTEQPFLTHLLELRSRLLKMVLAVIAVLVLLLPFANPIYSALAGPLLKQLPPGSQMIAIEVASPFLAPFKLTAVLALFLTVPYLLYQLWAFVAPGLYRHEKRYALPLLVSSSLLFYAGAAFAYFVVFPLLFGFLAATAPEGVALMTDINKYLDFVLTMFFAFGAAFEVPVATCIVILTGVARAETLAAKRPYVILAAFVIGAILTPPDGITQTLLAIPLWLLFELGLVAGRLLPARAARERATTPDDAALEAEFDRAIADEQRLARGEDVKGGAE